MKQKTIAYPPLTQDDISVLRGEPIAKKVGNIRNSPLVELEEWIYYNSRINVKESYCFKNGKLIKYKTQKVV
jgi:hypothetical protein